MSKFCLEICTELRAFPAAAAGGAGDGDGGTLRFRIDPDRPAPILEQARASPHPHDSDSSWTGLEQPGWKNEAEIKRETRGEDGKGGRERLTRWGGPTCADSEVRWHGR